MAIHWRSGFRRLVKVLAWGYWALCAVIIYNQAHNSMLLYNETTTQFDFRWDRLSLGLDAARDAFAVAATIFFVAVVITYGLRWIARGFADGEA